MNSKPEAKDFQLKPIQLVFPLSSLAQLEMSLVGCHQEIRACQHLPVPGIASPGKEVRKAQRGWVRLFLETQPGCIMGHF